MADVAEAPVRGLLTTGALALLLLVGGFGGWATQARIAAAVVVPARVAAPEGQRIIQHPRGGVVTQLLVRDGRHVAVGDVLLVLDASELHSERALVQAELDEVRAQRARLNAELEGDGQIRFPADMSDRDPELAEMMAGQRRLLQARIALDAETASQLEQRRQLITTQIAGLDAQLAAIALQQGVIEEETRSQQALLEKGLTQAGRVAALRREAARLEGRAGQVAQARARIIALDLERRGLRAARLEDVMTRLRDIGHRERALRERHRALSAEIAAQTVTAPVAGVVHDLGDLTQGSVVRPAESLMQIVPTDRAPRVEARITPEQIDRVAEGQRVTLRFPALDTGQSPELGGQITHLSADVLRDPATGRAFFRAEILLQEAAETRLPAGTVLIPGMPAEVYIRTGEHAPLTYLLKPLGDYVNRALRD
ncbi:HlyD family type I secretion periplasmic adaptor subunit [Roseovarius sp. ZX-A-9]|uniref:HlyD family type I secretion periplasmic adaptor subunit n=1 Tax=Roseovarius sp. ZX-A-9 TaxID=3014783 RepID=UPI00232BCF3F|nr:HlyD family type I secretion periplasmic adaptor subunit [Roseovarius sp. ZX-A-9]